MLTPYQPAACLLCGLVKPRHRSSGACLFCPAGITPSAPVKRKPKRKTGRNPDWLNFPPELERLHDLPGRDPDFPGRKSYEPPEPVKPCPAPKGHPDQLDCLHTRLLNCEALFHPADNPEAAELVDRIDANPRDRLPGDVTGVIPERSYFRARPQVDGKRYDLGSFLSRGDAEGAIEWLHRKLARGEPSEN
jgi:hypothetical protein